MEKQEEGLLKVIQSLRRIPHSYLDGASAIQTTFILKKHPSFLHKLVERPFVYQLRGIDKKFIEHHDFRHLLAEEFQCNGYYDINIYRDDDKGSRYIVEITTPLVDEDPYEPGSSRFLRKYDLG